MIEFQIKKNTYLEELLRINASEEMQHEAYITREAIFRMTLHSFLHTDRQSSYTEEEVSEFEIDINSPAMVLLEQDTKWSAAGPTKIFSWRHQSIREYQESQAVNKKDYSD